MHNALGAKQLLRSSVYSPDRAVVPVGAVMYRLDLAEVSTAAAGVHLCALEGVHSKFLLDSQPQALQQHNRCLCCCSSTLVCQGVYFIKSDACFWSHLCWMCSAQQHVLHSAQL